MKIGFFTDSYLPSLDGVSTTVETSAKQLERMGHEVIIVAPKYPNTKDRKNVIRIFSLKLTRQLETRVGLQFPQTSLLKILRHDFDIIHGHSGGPVSFLGWQIAKLYGVPYIATYHTFWNKYTHYFLKGVIRPKIFEVSSTLFGNVCEALVAPTQKVKNELRQYGIRKPIFVIPNGLETERFVNVKKGFLRNKYKIPKDAKIILCIARLGREKSVDFIIQSFKHIYEAEKKVYFFIVGTGPDKENLQNLAKKLGVSDRIIFTGPVKHLSIPKVYADADLFVFASKTETQGMVVLEAMASGIPVVSVTDKVFKNVVIDDVNGYLVKKNTALYAECVLKLIQNTSLRKKLGNNGRKTAEQYSIHEIAKSFVNLYENVLENNEINRSSWRESIRTLKTDFKDFVKPYSTPFSRVYLNIRDLNKIKDYLKRNLLE